MKFLIFFNLFFYFTKIGKTITPTVKRQIGATTINIDSRDINNFEFINR